MNERISKNLQRLDKFLCRIELDDETMLLSQLDGFLAGVVTCPDFILPSEWLPLIWGESGPVFDDERQANDILGLIMGHYNDILAELDRGDYRPIYDMDTDGAFLWQLWMDGFQEAILLRPDAWLDLSEDEDEEIQRALFILGRLAQLATLPAKELKPMEIDDALTDSAGDLIPIHVEILHRARLDKGSASAPKPSTPAKKVGRNEPCPCGSGKKFKKCCLNRGDISRNEGE